MSQRLARVESTPESTRQATAYRLEILKSTGQGDVQLSHDSSWVIPSAEEKTSLHTSQ